MDVYLLIFLKYQHQFYILSQIELRILAHISDSKELIEAFKNGQDIHTKVAADIYGVEECDLN